MFSPYSPEVAFHTPPAPGKLWDMWGDVMIQIEKELGRQEMFDLMLNQI